MAPLLGSLERCVASTPCPISHFIAMHCKEIIYIILAWKKKLGTHPSYVYLLTGFFWLRCSQEAKEVMSDSNGRWWSFHLSTDSLIIVEKKSVPERMQQLDCLEKAVHFDEVIKQLEDLGEATLLDKHVIVQIQAVTNNLFQQSLPLFGFWSLCFSLFDCRWWSKWATTLSRIRS